MNKVMMRTSKTPKQIRPARQLELKSASQKGLVPAVAPQVTYRSGQVNRDGSRPANLLVLQRTVGNRAVQRREGILRQAEPKKDQTPKAQQPPPNGTIAEGGALDDATITAVKVALKKGKTKRYIVYKDSVKVGGTLAWRANNPGNLRDASTKIARVPGQVGKFAVFATMEDGRKAQKDLYMKTYGDMKVRDAVAKLTPPSENDTKQYLKDVQAQGVNLDGTVKSQIDQIMEAVKKNEGMKEGIEVPRSPDQGKSSP